MRQAYLRASLFAEQDASASEPRGGEAWCGGDFQRVSEMSSTRTQKMQGLLHSPIYNPCLTPHNFPLPLPPLRLHPYLHDDDAWQFHFEALHLDASVHGRYPL